jgi:hypothetical protein
VPDYVTIRVSRRVLVAIIVVLTSALVGGVTLLLAGPAAGLLATTSCVGAVSAFVQLLRSGA